MLEKKLILYFLRHVIKIFKEELVKQHETTEPKCFI